MVELRIAPGRIFKLRSFTFLNWLSNRKLNIPQEPKNFALDPGQPDGHRTTAAVVRMDAPVVFLSVIVFQRVDEMEQIGEHAEPTVGSLAYSLYVRHPYIPLVEGVPTLR